MPEQPNITNIPSARVEIIDSRTGMISREWYRFFLNLFNLAGNGGNQTSLDDLQLGPPPSGETTSSGGGTGTVTSVDVSGGTTGITTTGGPITTSGTITLGLTGQLQTPTAIQMGNGSATTLAAGKMWYNQTTGAWNLGMGNGNITQQVGEEIFVYGKASAAITDSPLQIIYHTGTVGASSVITFGPTVAGITDANAIIGIATESLAHNDFGRATVFGVVRNITTDGTAFGQTWADDDVIWYDPVTGNPTNVEPVAPNIKVQVGLVIKAGSGGSGSFQVGINRGSTLGGTDSNVQFGTLANNNLIAYDSTLGYWKNVTSSALGFVTSVTGTSPVVSSGGTTPAISLAAGYGDTLNPYASKAANYFLAAPNGSAGVPTFRAVVAADISTLNQNTTGSAATLTTGRTIAITGDLAYTSPSFDGSTNVTAAGTLATVNATVGSFTNASITVNGKGLVTAASSGAAPVTSVTGTSPVVSSGGATPAISLATAYGDTLNPYASKTANFVLAAPNGSAGVPTFRAVVAADIPTLNQNTTGTASNVTGTVAIANGGTGQTAAAAAFNALSPITSTGDLIIGNGVNSATRLAIGTTSYVLTSNGTTATWAAAAGGGSNITALGLWENNASITANYTIGTGNNATSAGPISVAASIVVTVPTGSTWVVL